MLNNCFNVMVSFSLELADDRMTSCKLYASSSRELGYQCARLSLVCSPPRFAAISCRTVAGDG